MRSDNGYCNPIKSHEKFLCLQPMFLPKRCDISSPLIGWMLFTEGFRCVQIRGTVTQLNPMKFFCPYSLCSYLNVATFLPP